MSEEKISETQTTNIVKKYLTSEVKFILGLSTLFFAVAAPFYDIKTEIALIKQNHYAHIEAMTKQIEANSNDIKNLEKTEVELMKTIAENSVRLKQLEE